MVLDFNKTVQFTTILLLFFSCFDYVRTLENVGEIAASVVKDVVPETLAVEIQGHENTSGRKVRQFGYPLPPPLPFGFGVGYRPFVPRPAFYRPVVGGGGFAGGGFQRTRVVTRTQTRVVDRYRGGGFRGGFYG